jgi:hypothetical protein
MENVGISDSQIMEHAVVHTKVYVGLSISLD